MYYFFLYDSSGNKYSIPFEQISLQEELNKGMSGSLNVNYFALRNNASQFEDTPDGIIANSYRYFRLYRESVLKWSGVLVNRQINGSGGQATSYSLTFCDWINALERRITGNDSDWWYSSQDSGDIAWDIIDQTQTKSNGDLGITRGTHPTTINRDRTFRHDNIRNELIKMSQANLDNGYDMEITPEKVFNIFYPSKGSTKSNIVLDDSNIINWINSRPLSANIANSVTVLGAGQGDEILAETRTNATSQSTWGLQEQTLSEKDIATASNLQAKGDKLLEEIGTPQDKISVRVNDTNPDLDDYDLGDSLPVKIDIINFQQTLRVLKRSIQIQENGQAQVDISFDYE